MGTTCELQKNINISV